MLFFFYRLKLIWQGWSSFVIDKISDIKYKKYFDARYAICTECENNKHGICSICDCVVRMKTMAEDAECPEGKWLTIRETLDL